jgi:CO dehydrogenase maturation factor
VGFTGFIRHGVSCEGVLRETFDSAPKTQLAWFLLNGIRAFRVNHSQSENPMEKQIIAVCGKGGVGKTVFSALLARIMIDSGIQPLLLIDADGLGGLTQAIGEGSANTLIGARDEIIKSDPRGEKMPLANELDYLLPRAVIEYRSYSVLSLGRSGDKGYFYPAIELLRAAIDVLVSAYAAVLIDTEAGIEQINWDVTRRATRVITVLDGSRKSIEPLRLIQNIGHIPVSAVINRGSRLEKADGLREGMELLGFIPENRSIGQFNREGRSLWKLSKRNAAVRAVRDIAMRMGLLIESE